MTQPITTFTKHNLQFVREEIDAALLEVSLRLGITLKTGNISFQAKTCKITVNAACRGQDGEAVSPHAAPFKVLATEFGFKMSDLNRQFTFQGDRYQLIGLRPRAHRMPMVCQQISTGKTFHMGVDLVKMALEREDRAASAA